MTRRGTWGGQIVSVLALLAVGAASGAQAQTARLAVLADSVSAGAPFDVAVTVTHAPGQQVTFPEVPPGDPSAMPRQVIGSADVLEIRRQPPAVRGSVRVDSAVVRVVTFEADTARVGPVSVRVVTAGDTAVVRTGTVLVPVRSVLVGEAEPYEPAPIGPPETFASATPLWIGLGVLVVLVVAALVWGVVTTLRRPKTVAHVAPYPAAVARFDALAREAPVADAPPEAIEAHVVAARDALRQYLADRLRLPAREATTSEIAALLAQNSRVPPDAADAVRRALLPSDLVAFARVRPAPDIVARLREDARAAVEAVEAALRAQEQAAAEAARQSKASG